MTDQAASPEMAGLQFNFNNVDSAQGYNNTEPGTIAMFKISDTEFIKSKDKGTPGLKCTFEQTGPNLNEPDESKKNKGIGSTFPHTFWLTANALPRVQHLSKSAVKAPLSGDLTGPALCAMFKDKVLPLKVTAQIDEKKGRVYCDLAYGGFSSEEGRIEDISFSNAEVALIEKSKSVVSRSDVATADAEGDDGIAAAPVAGSEAESAEF